jgi:ADP-heptose:LPS heptosyltransferase
VAVTDIPILHDREYPTDSRGRYRYVSDGQRGPYHFLMPNRVLEAGRRLEDWLPEHPIDWNFMDEFDWSNTRRGTTLGKGLSPVVAFYLGPELGHTEEGHNREWLWEPRHWIELATAFRERGCQIAVIGAPYDRSFWERYVRDGVKEAGQVWADLIGKLEIGETFAFLRQARCLISYQCGLAIVGHYLGVRTAAWWRPAGDSCHPRHLVSFDERMAHCWTRPGSEADYLPLIYQRESPADIVAEIDRRGWLKEKSDGVRETDF